MNIVVVLVLASLLQQQDRVGFFLFLTLRVYTLLLNFFLLFFLVASSLYSGTILASWLMSTHITYSIEVALMMC